MKKKVLLNERGTRLYSGHSGNTLHDGALFQLGFIHMGLGLVGAYFIGYGLLIWAVGFGVVHIGYGIYMHYKYER